MSRKPKSTVQEMAYQVLRDCGITTIFGNPGSTELNFLTHFPKDFRYILGLHEATVISMADGYAQGTGNAALVNLHSAAGVGNALGNLFTAFKNHTPLVVTAGQQAREILLYQPYLGADQATQFPRPYVKWSIEPARPQDVPVAIAQAYEIAMQHPRGPVFVSIPSEDWSELADMPTPARTRHDSVPAPEALAEMAAALKSAKNPALVVGSAIDRDGAFDAAVDLAERMGATVFEAPVSSRANFPEDHPRFAGFLPAMPDGLSKLLAPHDVVAVVGAPVFTFHIIGRAPIFDSGAALWQITDNPDEAAHSQVATSLLGSMCASIKALAGLLGERKPNPDTPLRAAPKPAKGNDPMGIDFAIQAIHSTRPDSAFIVEEAPSHRPAIQRNLPITQAGGFFTMASGGLGWGLPASVGIALAHPEKRTICVVGDGSAMYSIQAIWTAAQLDLPVTFVVLNNQGYGALRGFAALMNSKFIPGMDVSGIDFVQLAASLGCPGVRATVHSDLAQLLTRAHRTNGPQLVEIAIDPSTSKIY